MYTDAMVHIEKLEDLIHHYIGNKKIVNSKTINLTVPGENYGSTILKVDLILEDNENMRESLSIFGKMIPESDFFRELFNVQVTFKLECALYATIVPTLQNFQREMGIKKVIDCFPKFYGARMSLENGKNVDKNAVLLLENMKVSGRVNAT